MQNLECMNTNQDWRRLTTCGILHRQKAAESSSLEVRAPQHLTLKKHTYWTNFKLIAIYFYSQFRGDGGVSWHGLGGQFIVAVWAIEEGLSALVVTWEVGVEDQTGARGGLRVQGAAARRGSILHIEAENINAQLKSEFFAVSLFHCWEYRG